MCPKTKWLTECRYKERDRSERARIVPCNSFFHLLIAHKAVLLRKIPSVSLFASVATCLRPADSPERVKAVDERD